MLNDGTLKLTVGPAPKPGNDLVGVRIKSKVKHSTGQWCGDLLPFNSPDLKEGPVFAFYVADKNPIDREHEEWDEIDFEFMSRYQNAVWTNRFHGISGADHQNTTVAFNVPLNFKQQTQFSTYCINWKADGTAIGTIDGVVMRNYTIPKPWKELYLYLSIWGSDEAAFWSGSIRSMTKSYSCYAKNIVYSLQ
ncbi:concanavalin A-like lectin/glucanase domain-containing protein [Globomyces pollinis-pini]|nr:concanavalin A-like lectin/glucanase domain-containing protein [Globomyces pollinis-pini]